MGKRAVQRITARAALLALALAACTDLGGFAGAWSGDVVAAADVRAGVPDTSRATLSITRAERTRLDASLAVDGETVALRPIVRAGNDALGALELPDTPLRSYLLIAPLAAGDTLAVVSLYADDRVDLRLVRSDTLYAVYHLHAAR